MKTHLRKFVELYKEFGIDCNVIEFETGEFGIILADDYMVSDEDRYTTSKRIHGNTGAITKIIFDADGNFVDQGIWG